jgi:hypothetical protein
VTDLEEPKKEKDKKKKKHKKVLDQTRNRNGFSVDPVPL